MAVIFSAQDGVWANTSTWSGGVVPTTADDVYIQHNVVFRENFNAKSITIYTTGSLSLDNTYTGWTGQAIAAQVGSIWMDRVLNDTRKVNLDGVMFVGITPSITCYGRNNDGFPRSINIIHDGTNVLIDDPGLISCSAEMQDIKPEGVAPAYARKVRNMVRYMTLTVKIKNTSLQYLASLYNMVRGPFQVLAVTHSSVIKGHIEAVVPDPSSVGKAYISVRVTIAEGPGA